jgi:type I site-specific restriction-modification system R (restriction) subunit
VITDEAHRTQYGQLALNVRSHRRPHSPDRKIKKSKIEKIEIFANYGNAKIKDSKLPLRKLCSAICKMHCSTSASDAAEV